MNNLFSIIIIILVFNVSGQTDIQKPLGGITVNLYAPAFNIKYYRICVSTIEISLTNDSIVNHWETNNHCEYKVDQISKTFSFTEWDSTNTIINAFQFDIVRYTEDEEVYQYLLFTEEGECNVVAWKNGKMIILEYPNSKHFISSCESPN